MNEKVSKQIEFIRNTGATNMFDVVAVLGLAKDFNFKELTELLEPIVDVLVYGNQCDSNATLRSIEKSFLNYFEFIKKGC